MNPLIGLTTQSFHRQSNEHGPAEIQSLRGRFLFSFNSKQGVIAHSSFCSQRSQFVELYTQPMAKRTLRPQFLLKQFLCFVKHSLIQLRVIDQFPEHTLDG